MKISHVFIIASVAILGVMAVPGQDDAFDPRRGVILDSRFFDRATSEGIWIVMFHAPWCGHCKRLKPVLAELSDHEAAKGLHIGFVDCTTERSLCDAQEVKGYPTIVHRTPLDSPNEWHRYMGERSLKRFIAFCLRLYHDNTIATTQSIPTVPEVGVAFVFAKLDDVVKAVVRKFLSYDDVSFYILQKEAPVASITLINDVSFGSDVITFEAPWTTTGVSDFVQKNTLRAFADVTGWNFGDLARRGEGRLVALIHSNVSEDNIYARESMLLLAKERKNSAAFSFAAVDGDAWIYWVENFGIHRRSYPTVLVYEFMRDVYYYDSRLAETVKNAWSTVETASKGTNAVREFLDGIEQGKIDDIPVSRAAAICKVLRPYIPRIDDWRRSFSDTAFMGILFGFAFIMLFAISVPLRFALCPPGRKNNKQKRN